MIINEDNNFDERFNLLYYVKNFAHFAPIS